MSGPGATLGDLEDGIMRLSALGKALTAIGTPRGMVETEVVAVMGTIVEETADLLRRDWEALLAQARGDA